MDRKTIHELLHNFSAEIATGFMHMLPSVVTQLKAHFNHIQ